MTKQDFQKELKEKVKAGVKPSHLRKSKSLDNIPTSSAANIPFKKSQSQLEISELKTKISQLQDQILQLRLEKIKEFGEYYAKKQALEKDLESNINYGAKEITRLENKLRTINKKRLELQEQLSQVQSKNARLELRLIEEQNKDTPLAPNSDWLTNYAPLILFLVLAALAVWLVSKNKHSHYH